MKRKPVVLLVTMAVLISSTMLLVATPAQAAASTKADVGISKIKASKKTVTIREAAKTTIKLTLNKKSKKALKISLKSSNAKVAKVAKKVIVKKGKKSTEFKITGLKKGTAIVTASFKTSANKTKKCTIKVIVKAKKTSEVKTKLEPLNSVSLSNTAPQIGDVLQAYPSNESDLVTYKWYMGVSSKSANTLIANEVRNTLTITENMAGNYIRVVAYYDGRSVEAVTKKPVPQPPDGVYSATIGEPDDPVVAKESNRIPITLHNNKGEAVTDAGVITGTRGIRVAPAQGTVVECTPSQVYVTLDEGLCDSEKNIKLSITCLASGKTVSKTVHVGAPAYPYDVYDYQGVKQGTVGQWGAVINLSMLAFVDQYGRRLETGNPMFDDMFSDSPADGKYQVVVSSSNMSVMNFVADVQEVIVGDYVVLPSDSNLPLLFGQAGTSELTFRIRKATNGVWGEPYGSFGVEFTVSDGDQP